MLETDSRHLDSIVVGTIAKNRRPLRTGRIGCLLFWWVIYQEDQCRAHDAL